MWAVAVHDFGIADRDFWRMTLAQFWLLWDRRRVEFKLKHYFAGIVAAEVWNSQRRADSQHLWTANEFIPRPAKDVQHDEIVLMLRQQLMELPPEHHAAARETWLKNLSSKGLDAKEILLEVFEGVE